MGSDDSYDLQPLPAWLVDRGLSADMTMPSIVSTANNINLTPTSTSSPSAAATPPQQTVATTGSVPADDTTTTTAILTPVITVARSTSTSTTSTSSTTRPKSSSTNALPPVPALPNLNISNGSCYAGPSMPLDSRFLPCGNAAAGIQTCCWQGDICLADHACFGIHDGGFNTYLAGCTDSQWNVTDPGVRNACPNKPAPYDTQPWIGLAFCGTSHDKDKNAWIACPQNNAPTTMLSAGPCVCPTVTQQRIVAFTDGPTLSSYASLPMTQGGSILWYSTFSPTYAVTATGMPTAAPTTPEGEGSTATNNGTPPPASPSPVKTSLVVGVAVGVGGFVLLAVIGALAFCWNVKRKRQRALDQVATENGEVDGGSGSNSQYRDDKHTVVGGEKQDGASTSPGEQSFGVSELEIRPARPWSMRSELDGGGIMPGDAGDGQTSHNLATRTSIATLLSSPPNSPPLSGDLHESSTVSSLHGQLTGQTTGQTMTGGGVRSYHPGAPNFETLVELEG